MKIPLCTHVCAVNDGRVNLFLPLFGIMYYLHFYSPQELKPIYSLQRMKVKNKTEKTTKTAQNADIPQRKS